MPPPRKTEFVSNPLEESRVRDIALEVVSKAINDFKCQPQTITENWTFCGKVDFEGPNKVLSEIVKQQSSEPKKLIGVEFTDEDNDEWRQIEVYTWLPREQAAPEMPTCSIAYLVSGIHTIQLTKGWSERPGVSPKSLEDCEETACWRAKGYLNVTKQTWSGFESLEVVEIHTNQKKPKYLVSVVEFGERHEIETDEVVVREISSGMNIFGRQSI